MITNEEILEHQAESAKQLERLCGAITRKARTVVAAKEPGPLMAWVAIRELALAMVAVADAASKVEHAG